MSELLEQALDALETGAYEVALSHFKQLLQQMPESGDIWHYRAICEFSQQDYPAAVQSFTQALHFLPEDYDLADNLIRAGYDLFKLKNYHQAQVFLKLLLENSPVFYAQAWLYLARSLKMLNQTDAAVAVLEKALALAPEHLNLLVEWAFVLPLHYPTGAAIAQWRQRFLEKLGYLEDWLTPERAAYWREQGVDLELPLLLLCQQGENEREVAQRIAALWQRVMPPLQTALLPRAPRRPDQKIRVGLVSASYWNHSTMHYFLGLLREMSVSTDFEIIVWYLGGQKQDHITSLIQGWFKDFRVLPLDVNHCIQQINRTLPDILLYLDIGLEPFSYILASNRLAPLQCVLPGLPMTTGLSQMDVYFSGKHFETEHAQAHYSEKLILTSGPIVTYYPPEEMSFKSREELGLPVESHLYVFPLTLFRLDPEFYQIMAQVLRADPLGEWVMMAYGQLETEIQQHLQQLPAELIARVRFLPWLSPQDYLSLLHQADVVFDGLRWGAGNIAFLSLWAGTPLVTYPGALLRNRIAAGLYDLLEMPELVAENLEQFVQIALRQATDKSWQQALRQRLQERKQRLFNQLASTQETLDFLRSQV